MESSGIERALELGRGARFCKCALHLKPYDYLVRNNKATPFADEAEYNKAIVEAALANGIEVVAITDHYRILSAGTLIGAAEAAGIVVFPGFEAVTKEGIHVLALFDPGTPAKRIERLIGDCGIHDTGAVSPTGRYDIVECVENAREWAAVFVAAHVYSSDGLLQALKGEARIRAWTNPSLLACSVAGPVSSAPDSIRAILENKDPNYKRARRMAILNAQDVVRPEDLADPSNYCWVKMSEATIEGLRQAFLEPESRIRLETDPAPTEHVELACIAWQGGFLDGEAIHLNENLNVLIGGRGTGKSTVVESIRYVLGLEPLGEEAAKNHAGIVQHVLKSGTKISLLVHSYRPNRRSYILERTVPNPPVVKDTEDDVLDLQPLDVVPGVEVYGQHELSELSRSPRKLARLLDRFVRRDDELATRRDEVRRELEGLRISRLKLQKESEGIRSRLSRLPVLEETLGRFKEAGLEDRLKERSEIVREETILKSVDERIRALRIAKEKFEEELPIDTAFVSAEALDGLGGAPILAPARESLEKLSERVEALLGEIGVEIAESESKIRSVKADWDGRREHAEQAYSKILRELQDSGVDGAEYIQVRQQVEELEPQRQKADRLSRDIRKIDKTRRKLLAPLNDNLAQEFRSLQKAAERVTKQLSGRVRVDVAYAGDRTPLETLLKEQVSGRLAETVEALSRQESLSLEGLASAIREGTEGLVEQYSIPVAQADRIAASGESLAMLVEELELAATVSIELNVAAEGSPGVWQALEALSTGQKATAILLLLLLESDAPLIVDQPEDDLDNRFITGGVVPRMLGEKRRRQFVFSTHNANIPVLGDAGLIVGLTASGEGRAGHAVISLDHLGSIDSMPVKELVEEVLEGGKEAFLIRHEKYGF